MRSLCKAVAAGAAAALLSTAAPLPPDAAEAGMPAPLPTQIPIRDINTPPSSGIPAKPFSPRVASHKSRRGKAARRHAAKKPAAAATPKAAPAPAPAPAANRTQTPGLPRLEQRYEPATETILPVGPETSPAIFPPEPAPAKTPAKI